eukprot:s3412_g7.t1
MAFERFVAAQRASQARAAKGDDAGSGWSQEALLSGAGWEAMGKSTRSFRELYGFPATLAWAVLQLKDFPCSPARRVEVWVIGARSGMEGWLAEEGSWDFLTEVFPTSSWKLCLIGPEMREEDLRLGDRVEVDSARLQGHEWIQKDGLCPDLVVCFNSGIGTLSLSITRPWLPTVAALLKLDVPVLFTCFGLKERKGEEFLLRGLFKARVLVDFVENPFRQRPGDRPGCYRSLEEESLSATPEGEAELCNAQLWWAQGSQLSAEELDQVALKAPKVLEELTQSYALQGAHRSWILALKEGKRRVGEAAVENFQVAFNNADVLRALSKFAKHIADAMVSFIRRHGPHPKARQCVEIILLAKVRRMLPAGHDDQELVEAVTERMREDYADVFGTADGKRLLRGNERSLMEMLESGELDLEDLEEEEAVDDDDMDDEEQAASSSAWANGQGPDGMGCTAVVALVPDGEMAPKKKDAAADVLQDGPAEEEEPGSGKVVFSFSAQGVKDLPGELPVVVYSFPGGKKSRKKLLVRHDTTGGDFVKLVRKQCPWAADGNVWIKKGGGRLEVPEHLLVKDLDSLKYKAADDVLYVEVLEVEKIERNTKAKSEPQEEMDMSKMSKSVQEFKMNAADLGAQVMKATHGSCRVREQAREMCVKHPDRVPVLVNQPESPGLPRIRKNYTVLRTMTVRDLRKRLMKLLQDQNLQGPDIPWNKVKMLMAGNEVQEDQCMGDIYDSMVDPDDGGLQLHLELDESFESFESFAFLSKPLPLETEDLPHQEPKAAFQGPSFEEVKHLQMALAEAAEAEKLREQREQEAEIQIEELRRENQICQEELRQEMDTRLTLESHVQVLQAELQSQVKTLTAAQFALSHSLEETSAAQQKNLLLEERIVALEAQLQEVLEAELLEVTQVTQKAAPEEGDMVMVGWDPETGRPVISEECSQIQALGIPGLQTLVGFSGFCKEFRTNASPEPVGWEFTKDTVIRLQNQDLYNDMVERPLVVSLRDAAADNAPIGTGEISLVPLLHDATEVSLDLELKLAPDYYAKWWKDDEADDPKKKDKSKAPAEPAKEREPLFEGDAPPPTILTVSVKVEELVGPLEDRECWTILTLGMEGVFALPEALTSLGVTSPDDFQAHPISYKAMLLGEPFGEGLLTKAAEAPFQILLSSTSRDPCCVFLRWDAPPDKGSLEAVKSGDVQKGALRSNGSQDFSHQPSERSTKASTRSSGAVLSHVQSYMSSVDEDYALTASNFNQETGAPDMGNGPLRMNLRNEEQWFQNTWSGNPQDFPRLAREFTRRRRRPQASTADDSQLPLWCSESAGGSSPGR